MEDDCNGYSDERTVNKVWQGGPSQGVRQSPFVLGTDFSLKRLQGCLIIKKCIVGTLPLGLAGSGTNEFSALTLENSKYRPRDDAAPIAFLMIATACNMLRVK